ncbi:relaxase/mobilization nuclease domain-containing protein [Niabella defluvii]|nr:relaxase/mobilization nuclease domain-containing protein [Niabella sp. I65]
MVNNKTEKPVRHISLNPDPEDKVSDEDFRNIAEQYMREMGYGNQPYAVFKHTDIERTHIHIVTTCVELNGNKIPDSFDHARSMAICRKLEQSYNLKPAKEKNRKQDGKIFKAVNCKAGDIKSQMASVLRHINKYYQFTNLGTYNALLSLYNIKAEEVSGELHGKFSNGIVYSALDENGNKISRPIKASLFGKQAGYDYIQTHYESSKRKLKNSPIRTTLKVSIAEAMKKSDNETMFKQQLLTRGIDTITRRNEQGRIYGISFIDHRSKSVWNGSQLDKIFSANVFNDWWNHGRKPDMSGIGYATTHKEDILEERAAQTHQLFDFLNHEKESPIIDVGNLVQSIGSLLPIEPSDNYEQPVNTPIKKKKKGRKFGRQVSPLYSFSLLLSSNNSCSFCCNNFLSGSCI